LNVLKPALRLLSGHKVIRRYITTDCWRQNGSEHIITATTRTLYTNAELSINVHRMEMSIIRGCNQNILDCVDKEIYSYLRSCSLRSDTKGYDGKTH
jgi:hypothetical protein